MSARHASLQIAESQHHLRKTSSKLSNDRETTRHVSVVRSLDKGNEVRKFSPEISALLEPKVPNEMRELHGDVVRAFSVLKPNLKLQALITDNIRYKLKLDTRSVQKIRFVSERLLYALGTAFIQPHRILAESLYDRLKATLGINSAHLHNMIDNQRRITRGSLTSDPQTASFDDILPNGSVIRSRNGSTPPLHIAVPDIGTSDPIAAQFAYRKTADMRKQK